MPVECCADQIFTKEKYLLTASRTNACVRENEQNLTERTTERQTTTTKIERIAESGTIVYDYETTIMRLRLREDEEEWSWRSGPAGIQIKNSCCLSSNLILRLLNFSIILIRVQQIN